MARDPPGSPRGLPLRGADGAGRGLSQFPDEPRPRILPFLGALAALLAIVVYGVPIVTTGDPLWPLPTDTRAQTLVVYWDGRRAEIARGAPGYDALMGAANAALSSPQGIEYRYGLPPSSFASARASGRGIEAVYASGQRAHGAYALGEFTRLFIFFSGEEYERGMIFLGDAEAYRSGPMRARDLAPLRELAAGAVRG